MTARFAAALVALTVVVLASLMIPLGVNHARERKNEVLVAAERDALGLGDALEDLLENADPDAAAEATRVAERYRADTGGRVLVVDAAGISLADTDPPAGAGDPIGRSFATRPEIETALGGRTAIGNRESETLGEELLFVAAPVRSGGRVLGVVRISRSRADIDADARSYWLRLGGIGAVTLVTAAGIGLLLGRWVTRPVRALQLQTRAFGRGDLDARAHVESGPPEIRELADQFNQAADRLATSLRTTSQFAADAAHQLRTPLTALRLRIDNLAAAAEGGPVDADGLDALVDELGRLDRTIDVLLALASLDERVPHLGDLDLHDQLARAVVTWQETALDQGVELRHERDGAVVAVADPDHVEQIVDNLLANAIAAVPPGTAIDLEASVVDGRPELRVVDHGPGMAPDVRARARQRHWHERAGGSGLGLAIVDRLCRHDRAELVLDETSGGGLTARIRFPPTAPTP